jgi:hypothetical protein
VSILFRANIRDTFGGEPAERYIIIRRGGPLGTITAMDGYDLYRLIVRDPGDVRLESFDAEAQVRDAINSSNTKIEILSVRPWRRQQVLARHYRVGDIYLAGDAAHVMVPTGGFGANTGIGDSVDLAWKLNAVECGWGGAKLLDSYETERRPIAKRNMAAAIRNYGAWTPSSELSLIEDDTAAAEKARKHIGLELIENTRAEWESTGVALGYSYLDSPICISDGTSVPPDDPANYVPTARPGSRAPHGWLVDGRSLLDLYGRGFTLVRFEGDNDHELSPFFDVAESRGIAVRLQEIRRDALHRLYQSRLVLVRPDGHVAWRGDHMPKPCDVLSCVTGA